MKREIPMIITAVVGVVLIISFFVPYAMTWGETATTWFGVIAAVAFILGGGNLQTFRHLPDNCFATCEFGPHHLRQLPFGLRPQESFLNTRRNFESKQKVCNKT